MNFRIKLSHTFLFIAMTLLFVACNKDDDSTEALTGPAKVQVFLTDTPGVYDAVMVDILKIEVHSNQGGWVALNPINAGVYNLLDFTNGIDTLLGTASLPSGRISQIRLFLGTNNSVVIDSVSHDLSVPSSMQSGLKLNLQQDLSPGITYKVWLDFDAGRSVVDKGNGSYSLKPVIRAFSQAVSGAIKGIASPDTATAHVMAITGTDTSGTTPDSTGSFLIGGLAGGTYNVVFTNMNGFKDTTVTGVSVVNGVVTDLGVVVMKK